MLLLVLFLIILLTVGLPIFPVVVIGFFILLIMAKSGYVVR